MRVDGSAFLGICRRGIGRLRVLLSMDSFVFVRFRSAPLLLRISRGVLLFL